MAIKKTASNIKKAITKKKVEKKAVKEADKEAQKPKETKSSSSKKNGIASVST